MATTPYSWPASGTGTYDQKRITADRLNSHATAIVELQAGAGTSAVPRAASATPAEGASSVAVDVTAHPVMAGREGAILAWVNGLKVSFAKVTVDVNRVTVTVTPDYTLTATDEVEILYDAEN